MKKNLIIFICFCIIFLNILSAALNVSLSDQGTNVKDKNTGNLLTSGNLKVIIYDNLTGGNLIHSETFSGTIVNGSWNVMLGENSSNSLQLEFGKIYYKDYEINGLDLDFIDFQGNTVERQFFYSPLGDISGEDISESANLTIANLTANYGFFSYLGSLANRITKLFAIDVNISNNVDVGGNVSASYFIGDGSQLTGVIASSTAWNRSGSNVFLAVTGDNVGIGTTTPQNKLNVLGDINFTGLIYGDGSQLTGISGGEDSLWTNVSGVATYYGNANVTGNLTLGGQVTGQNVSRVRATRETAQTIPTATWTVVQYDTENFDNLGEWDATTNFRFQPEQAGYYHVDTRILLNSATYAVGNYILLGLAKNGKTVSYLGYYRVTAAVTTTLGASGSDVIYLTPSDYIDIRINHNQGGDINLYNSAFYNYVSIQRIHSPLTIGGTAGGVPAGAIMAFNSETCPAGWIPADGTSGTPDLRGLFVRGAGTSGVLKWANGSYMTAPFGTYQNDSMQGHIHAPASGWTHYITYRATGGGNGLAAGSIVDATSPTPPSNDGTYGTPRTGAETRPASYVLTYCVKTTEDSATSNTLFQESGGIISTANSSHQVDVKIRSYNTSWVSCSDWTDQHLGTTLGGNVTHNLNAPLSELLIKVVFSDGGTDATSSELLPMAMQSAATGDFSTGLRIFQVDSNTVKVQTGASGIWMIQDAAGSASLLDTESAYYKIKVWKLG